MEGEEVVSGAAEETRRSQAKRLSISSAGPVHAFLLRGIACESVEGKIAAPPKHLFGGVRALEHDRPCRG